MNQDRLKCRTCSGELRMDRRWKQVLFCCRSCGAQYPVEEVLDQMNDTMETLLANIQCDRI